MTINERVEKWSKAFNLPILKDGAEFPKRERTELSLGLIREELKELEEAIDKEDIVEVCDAAGDLVWVALRFMMEHGIDPNKCITEIFKSNMSKLDYSDEDAAKTYKKYLDQGIPTYVRFNKESGGVITHRKTDHKVMKSHRFVEPDFTKLIKDVE